MRSLNVSAALSLWACAAAPNAQASRSERLALVLPYTLQLAGQGPFYAKAGVPACVAMARDELKRQKSVVARGCARDGGRLTEGEIVETMVQGVHCTAVQPLTCALHGAASHPTVAEPDAAPRS